MPLVQHASELASKAKLKTLVKTSMHNTGKDLPPMPIGSKIMYDSNPDHKTKRPEWSKGTIKDVSGPGHKYTIQSDDSGRVLTRTRRDVKPNSIGTYMTNLGDFQNLQIG